MSGEEIRQVVLKNRAYFEKAVKQPLRVEWKYRMVEVFGTVRGGICNADAWVQAVGHFAGVAISIPLLAVSPVWLLVTSIIWRRRVRRILSEGGAA